MSMAYRVRYVMQFNAREAIHLLELRSAPQGHPSYRRIVLEMHRLIAEQAGHRAVADAMSHLDRGGAGPRAAGVRASGRDRAERPTLQLRSRLATWTVRSRLRLI